MNNAFKRPLTISDINEKGEGRSGFIRIVFCKVIRRKSMWYNSKALLIV